MSSLRGLIGEALSEIRGGVAWVAIYKDGRSWQAEAFYPEDGDYENGYVFDEYDYARMKEIGEIDGKALCINGDYAGGFEDFTLKELEDKIFEFYVCRHHQLWHFVDDFVVPPEISMKKQGTVDGIIAGAEARSETQEYCASIYNLVSKDIWFGSMRARFFSGRKKIGFCSMMKWMRRTFWIW